MIRNFIAAALAAASLAAPAQADRLQDVLDNGTLRVGVLLDAAPWGFTDDSGAETGLDVELAKLMAKDLNADLELVPLTGQSRIPSLLSGKVDLLIAAAGATPERAQMVMFSQPYAAVTLGVYGAADAPTFDAPGDLEGARVAVAKGSTLDTWLTDNAPGIQLSRFEDTPAAIAAFLAGQVDYFAENSAIALKVGQDNPSHDVALAFQIRQSPAHAAVAQGEQNFLNWINTFLFFHRMSGDLGDLQETFFGERQELPNL
ncbi:transporter substrate-binding domain-containing protein [Ponticoccus alexandrii]|uniref:Transporter substrate-binding domain-containing protein n=1 Tax=Ponticoccus alexandrii TaxID=1943633 RepID=A0ABX7FFT1_9RHOB|nr:transporter substrate-binding domain-containing protein [Ponticoccus alexandrii]ETA49427.1 ABC transporter substrate-binding protein [Rhodobacteraceae bacterium PD-2]QRF69319.1 transporter substrate-binding domain-containing protein [Ponticoccus alexandrii]